MKIIACVDDNMGLLFNNRRQSRDKVVIEQIIELTKEQTLFIHTFSEKLFENKYEGKENFLESATEEDFCFVENVSVLPHKDQIQEIHLFRWNRNYPGDFYFDLNLEEYQLQSIEEFAGNSHEKITKEVWVKRD